MEPEYFDEIVSLGYNCEVSFNLNRLYTYVDSYPLTWALCSPAGVADFLENPDMLISNGLDYDPENPLWKSRSFAVWLHGKMSPQEMIVDGVFSESKREEDRMELLSRMTHLIDKFKKMLANDELRKLFVLSWAPVDKSPDHIIRIYNLLQNKTTNFKLVLLVSPEIPASSVEKVERETGALVRRLRFLAPAHDAVNINRIDVESWNNIFADYRPAKVKDIKKSYKFEKTAPIGNPAEMPAEALGKRTTPTEPESMTAKESPSMPEPTLEKEKMPFFAKVKQFAEKIESRLFENPALIKKAFLFLILSFVGYVFLMAYVHREQYIYFWDYYAYPKWFGVAGESLLKNPLEFFRNLLVSMQTDEYTFFPMLFLAPFYYLFGGGRESYISAVYWIYFIPSMFILLLIAYRGFKESMIPGYRWWGVTAAAFFCVPMWTPVFRGFTDVCVVIPIGLAIYLFLCDTYLRKRQIFYSFLIALSLGCCFSFRRWMAFAILTFILTALIFVTAEFIRHRSQWKIMLKNLLINGLAGIIGTVPVFVLHWKRFLDILQTDYSLQHAPWAASYYGALQLLYSFNGRLVVAGLLLGVAALLFYRKKFLYFNLLYVVLYCVLFLALESMGRHHEYGMIIPLFILYSTGFMAVFSLFRLKGKFLTGAWILLLIVMGGVWINMFFGHIPVLNALTPSLRHHPMRRDDYAALIALNNKIRELTEKKPDCTFSVMAAGNALNSDLVDCYDLYSRIACKQQEWKKSIMDNYRFVHIVDTMEPLSAVDVNADYLIVTDPADIHLAPKYQQNVQVLTEKLLTRTGIGKAYEPLPERFPLINPQDGTPRTAMIFKKLRPIRIEERLDTLLTLEKRLAPELTRSFPKGYFTTQKIRSQIKQEKDDILPGQVNFIGNERFFLHPGQTPTAIEIPFMGMVSTVSFKIIQPETCSKGNVIVRIFADGKKIYEKQFTNALSDAFSADASKIMKFRIEVDKNGGMEYDSVLFDHFKMDINPVPSTKRN